MSPGTKIEFGFGVELYKDGAPLRPDTRKRGVEFIIAMVTDLFGGCTLVDTPGTWRNPHGILFEERGKTLIVYTTSSCQSRITAKIKQTVTCIKEQLGQEAVAVTVTQVSTGLL